PVYPNLDPTRVPATFSRLIVEDYLRGELGFRGAIVSDDLEMGAIVQSCPVGEAAVRAAQAGHDLLLVCHTEAAQRAAAAALFDAYRADRLPRRGLEAAAERVRRLREQRRARSGGGPPVREREGPRPRRGPAARSLRRRAPACWRPRDHGVRLQEVPARRGHRAPRASVSGTCRSRRRSRRSQATARAASRAPRAGAYRAASRSA